MFRKLKLLFTYGTELEQVLIELRRKNEDKEREAKRYYLNLCAKHQPCSPGSIYAEHNCDHCALLKEINND